MFRLADFHLFLPDWKKQDISAAGASYVMLTDYGKKKLEEQQDITLRFYEHVIERFGREKARELDKLMLELESVLRDELKLMNDQKEGGKTDE